MSMPLNIIAVEDRPADAGLIERELRQGGLEFFIRRADNPTALALLLRESAPDVVLSDLSMPFFSGTEALAMVRVRYPETPLIFVSGTIGEEKAVDLLKLGATDFVLKQHLSRLPAAVLRALREVEMGREQRRSQERYRSLFENATIGIFSIDQRGRYLAINPALAKMHGYCSREEMLAAHETCQDLIVDISRVRELVKSMRKDGPLVNVELELYRADMTALCVLLHSSAVRDRRTRELHYEGFVVDVTRQRELEQQMLRAQRMESIGTLASGVAHDLNNIIAPILMAAPLLHPGMTPEEHTAIVDIIETSALRGAQIVQQVLTLGRGLEGERQPLQSSALIKEVAKIVSETFPKDITLLCTIGSSLWPVIGNATQIHQVLLNLCVNARDAMPAGGYLTISAENLDVDDSYASMLPQIVSGSYVLLTVADNGTGIPPKIMERIFDPFFTTKGIGEGTGLGLSTLLGIVKRHQGFVHVTSEEGKGATFSVYLPAAAGFMPEPEAVPETGNALKGHGELVLLVDDEEMIRLAARNVLEANGYTVLTANDGTDALAVFAQQQTAIEIVVTDLMMPYMDGVALIRALHRMAPRLLVIATTGQSEKTRSAELRSMGVGAVLDKPYRADTLLRTIQERLKSRERKPLLLAEVP